MEAADGVKHLFDGAGELHRTGFGGTGGSGPRDAGSAACHVRRVETATLYASASGM